MLKENQQQQLTTDNLNKTKMLSILGSLLGCSYVRFDGMLDENNEDINYYYPTSRFGNWSRYYFLLVARMIMAGLEFKGKFLSKMFILQELLG